MPLNVYPDVYSSGSVPAGWVPIPGRALKDRVRNIFLLRYLRALLPGRWRKVIKPGFPGDIHYFEHESGRVADVKYYPRG